MAFFVPLKTPKTSDFLTFSGGVAMQHWCEMGQQVRGNFVLQAVNYLRDHSFRTYASFPKKYFLPPDTHTYVCISGSKEY